MTDEQVTQLSALVDGELSSPSAVPLVESMVRDPALRGTWERYHLISQVLRGERVDPAVRTLASAVRERLTSEPTLLVPRAAAPRSRLWRTPFAGAALAAAAAFLAVFAVPGFYQGPEFPRTGPAYLAGGVPQAIPVMRRWETDRTDLAGKLDLFLMTHQEASPASGVKGMLPYATLVGYEAGR